MEPAAALALCSWAAFNHAWFGLAGRPWTEGGAKLLERGLIDVDTSHAITRLWHFGRLIGNTDMHDGNLSFTPRVSTSGSTLNLAPVYDMLPMLYAPQRGVELPPVTFTPRLPLPAEREALATSGNCRHPNFGPMPLMMPRISAEFRAACDQNALAVRKAMGLLGGSTGSVSR